jgi:CheY-like chemotaxis protein
MQVANQTEERVHPRAGSSSSPLHDPSSLAGLNILVVDDEPDARDLIRRVLEDCGATVVTADSAAEALSLLHETTPDVLVSDIGMPGQDGYEFIDSVRKLETSRKARKVPALALTAFARWEDRTRALIAGYEMHVSKPVEPFELVASVAALVRRSS